MKRKPFILYHWSPVERRKQIQRQGLRIGRKCVQHSPGWTPTYLCFSDSPSLAWALSGAWSTTEREWDLWMCWSTSFKRVYKRSDMRKDHPAEWRTNEGIPKRLLWLVGTRKHTPRKKKPKAP